MTCRNRCRGPKYPPTHPKAHDAKFKKTAHKIAVFFKSHATVTSRDVELTKETTSQSITTSSRRPYSDKHNDKQRTFVSTTHSKHPLCEPNVTSNSQQLMNMATTAFAVHAVKPQRLMNAATTSFAVNALKLPRPGQNCAELQDIFHCSVEH